MSLAAILQHSAELWLVVGLLGSLIEAVGERKKWPALVAFGQRLEAASVDLPKLIRGSRKTAADAAKGAVVLLLFLGLAPALTSCSSSLPQPDKALADAKAAVAEAEAVAKRAAEVRANAIKTARDTIATVTAARALALSAGVVPKDVEEQTGVALGYASDVLGKVEKGEQVARDELLAAVDAVAGVVASLRKLGREVEPLVESSLQLVRAAVEAS